VSACNELPSCCYGPIEGEYAYFTRVCPKCGRFVKADVEMVFNGIGQSSPAPNATCSRCGRVVMYFEGYYPAGGEW